VELLVVFSIAVHFLLCDRSLLVTRRFPFSLQLAQSPARGLGEVKLLLICVKLRVADTTPSVVVEHFHFSGLDFVGAVVDKGAVAIVCGRVPVLV
jgi:hypothetical protein